MRNWRTLKKWIRQVMLGGFLLIAWNRCTIFPDFFTEGGKLVYQHLGASNHAIYKKYRLKPGGSGVAMCGGPVRHLSFYFSTSSCYSKDELRRLAIECAHLVIAQINADPAMYPHLHDPPFRIQHVHLMISNHTAEGEGLLDPDIGTVHIDEGKLVYWTYEPNKTFHPIKHQYIESYEEALCTVQSQLQEENPWRECISREYAKK